MKLSELYYIQLLDEARQAILCEDTTAVHYLKEISSRFEKLESENKLLRNHIKTLESKNGC